MSALGAPSPAERGRIGEGALLEGPPPLPSPAASRGEGAGALAVVDALACATMAAFGAIFAHAIDPLTRFGVSDWGEAAVAIPFALLGPLGAGIYRGEMKRVVAVLVAAGAALGALGGAVFSDGLGEPVRLAVRAALPLLVAPLLAYLGTRFHRPDEPWREEARRGPVDATPALAVKIAQARLPLILRVLLAPLGLALLPLALAGIVFIRCYQLGLSRFLPPQCRFEPSCSRYGLEAFFRLGAVKGFLLTAFRVARCQPFCRAGHDPVPGAHG